MKKLMFTAAVAAAMGAFAAIESANTVGYMDMSLTNSIYAPVGACFMTVGQTSFRLGDIVPENGTLTTSEYLQEFDPLTGAIGEKYYYIDAATAANSRPMSRWSDPTVAVGWWKDGWQSKFDRDGVGTAERADNLVFAAGSGFYSNFAGKKATLTVSGEVVMDELQISLTNKIYAPVINYLPRTITLGEIVPENGTLTTSEYLQEFDPLTGAIGEKYYYIDATTAANSRPMSRWTDPTVAVGWWKDGWQSKFDRDGVGTAERADNVQIASGAGLYSNFAGKKAKLNFPKAIPTPAQD